MRTFVAAVGDAESPATWSGIPYHFLRAGQRAGLLDGGLHLSPEGPATSARRVAWNLGRMAGGDRAGGFQYSDGFLERLWAAEAGRIRGARVVNCFQLYAPSVVADPSVEKWFFVDVPLARLFEHYGIGARIGRKAAADALRREREGYAAARGVIAHSRWAADSVVADCGAARDRVHVVVPGAGFEEEPYVRWEAAAAKARAAGAGGGDGPLRLVFVGKDWRRKGLDRLLPALRAARARGLDATLRVIGCERASLPPDLAATEGVEWAGFVDKAQDPDRFLRLAGGADVGCLLSRAEAGGIALREYHALGLVVLGPDTGGAPEHRIAGASLGVDPAATPEAVADLLLSLRSRPDWADLRSRAWDVRRRALWGPAVEAVGRILGGGGAA